MITPAKEQATFAVSVKARRDEEAARETNERPDEQKEATEMIPVMIPARRIEAAGRAEAAKPTTTTINLDGLELFSLMQADCFGPSWRRFEV